MKTNFTIKITLPIAAGFVEFGSGGLTGVIVVFFGGVD